MTTFDFIKTEPITKGWSEDKKYCVTKADGTKYLLRVTPISRYETRKALFEMLGQVSALGVSMCQPIEFGTCTDGVYALHSWIDGEDAEKILPYLTETEQYVLGIKSGEILLKMHSIPAPSEQEDWAIRFNRKTNYKIQKYRECGLKFNGDDKIIEYIENNRNLLESRPQCFQHGDYHVGNMMIEHGELRIIDFDRYDFGDPWEEFNRIVWSATVSPHFATGQLNGYFGGKPPIEFFKLLAFYIASNTLSSIYWAIPFGQSDIDTMMKQSQDVLAWFDNMENPVPTFYLSKYSNLYVSVIQHYDALIDEINDPSQSKVVDPAHDTEPLREYMNKWDGAPFMEMLELAPNKSVLEIGVGTGRLALRVCGNCENFTGIDISPKTVEHVRKSLREFQNTHLICADFSTYTFSETFDVIYSSLTFMHIKDKRSAIQKATSLLNPGGRFVLSVSKSQQREIDYGTRRIPIFPDKPEEISAFITEAGLDIEKQFETEFAVIFATRKEI